MNLAQSYSSFMLQWVIHIIIIQWLTVKSFQLKHDQVVQHLLGSAICHKIPAPHAHTHTHTHTHTSSSSPSSSQTPSYMYFSITLISVQPTLVSYYGDAWHANHPVLPLTNQYMYFTEHTHKLLIHYWPSLQSNTHMTNLNMYMYILLDNHIVHVLDWPPFWAEHCTITNHTHLPPVDLSSIMTSLPCSLILTVFCSTESKILRYSSLSTRRKQQWSSRSWIDTVLQIMRRRRKGGRGRRILVREGVEWKRGWLTLGSYWAKLDGQSRLLLEECTLHPEAIRMRCM